MVLISGIRSSATPRLDDSEGGVLVRRYESDCERELHRAVAELRRGVIPGIQEEEQEIEEEQEGEEVTEVPEATPGSEPRAEEPPVGFVPPAEDAGVPAALAPAPFLPATTTPARSEAVEAALICRTKLVQG